MHKPGQRSAVITPFVRLARQTNNIRFAEYHNPIHCALIVPFGGPDVDTPRMRPKTDQKLKQILGVVGASPQAVTL